MTLVKAIKVLVKAAQKQLRFLAVDANLYEHYGARYPHAEKAFKQREELREAVKMAEAFVEDRK